MLSKIKSPTVFIKATTSYEGDLLVVALLDEEADHVVKVLGNGKRINVDSPGHDIYYDKLEEFIEIIIDFLDEI